MELIEGETLQARVRREGPMRWPLALDVLEQVARALIAAEAHTLVHRDLKPSNIMMVDDPSGTNPFIIKVIDFGLAKAAAAEHDESHGSFSGTPRLRQSGTIEQEQNSDGRAVGYLCAWC